MPGWKAFVEPILRCIDPTLGLGAVNLPKDPEIITLGAPTVLVKSTDLADALKTLTTLLTSHPAPSLAKRLLRPIMMPLWALSSWASDDEHLHAKFIKPARHLLKMLVQLWPSTKDSTEKSSKPTLFLLDLILHDLTFKGKLNAGELRWEYAVGQNGGIQIQWPSDKGEVQHSMEPDLEVIDVCTEKLIQLIIELTKTPDFDHEVSQLFVRVCTKWLSDTKSKGRSPIITQLSATESEDDLTRQIVEAKVMQKLMSALPEKLISDSRQVLDLVNQILQDFVTNNAGDNNTTDAVAVALSLLNIVLTSTSLQMPDGDLTMSSIELNLQRISRLDLSEISSTAQNLLLLIKFRNTISTPSESPASQSTDQQVEDRKTFTLALSYLTATESPPPVRVQGLELLSSLLRSKSSILDIPALLVLFSSLLQDSEEYIYLRAIQSFIQLSQKHPKAVMKDLIDRYVDPNEDYQLDQRLRLGEALLQVIQNNPVSFSGDTARSVCEGLLFLASRRGYRPKTEQEQAKRNKLKRKQNEEAEEAWEGPVPQLDEVLEMGKDDEEILAQILEGWESKRGSEDLRIRASAIAILGSALEVNIAGLDSNTVATTIDLSIHILTLEPESESAIARRSAILLILSFVKALDAARSEGKKIGFGFAGKSLEDISRILEYISHADNDGLVRQHAEDVLEGLKTWQMNSLLPMQGEPQTEIKELAGLSITPGGNLVDRSGKVRPRIEEID
jgi:hypothetical protein